MEIDLKEQWPYIAGGALLIAGVVALRNRAAPTTTHVAASETDNAADATALAEVKASTYVALLQHDLESRKLAAESDAQNNAISSELAARKAEAQAQYRATREAGRAQTRTALLSAVGSIIGMYFLGMSYQSTSHGLARRKVYTHGND